MTDNEFKILQEELKIKFLSGVAVGAVIGIIVTLLIFLL